MCLMIWFFDGMFVKNPMKHVRLVLIIREPYFKNFVKKGWLLLYILEVYYCSCKYI